jgi:hypothetical protein
MIAILNGSSRNSSGVGDDDDTIHTKDTNITKTGAAAEETVNRATKAPKVFTLLY